jgi:metal-sulfur cluster biosynthetic enzyme
MSSENPPESPAPDDPEPPAPEDGDEEATPCAYTEYVEGDDVESYPATGEGAEGVAADVWAVLHDVDDPEMPVSIVDLGLIYGVDVAERDGGAHATVVMTLTYTGCPARKYLTEEIEERVAGVEGVAAVDLELVWSPPWSMEMVTDDGKEQLREFGLSV